MASIRTNTIQYRNLILEVWNQENDIPNNRSRYSWKLTAGGSDPQVGWWVYGRKFEVTIGGHKVLNHTGDMQLTLNRVVGAGTTPWIGHSTDGSKTVSMHVIGAIYTHAQNVSASGSFTASRIPRAATVTGGTNFNDEQNPTINYSNPAGNAVQELVAALYIGSTAMAHYRGVNKTGTSYTFSLTESERNVLRNSTSTMSDPKQSVRFILRTKIGDVFYYSEISRIGSVVNYNPSIGPAYHWNSNASHVSLTGSNQKYIKGYSPMSVGLTVSNFVVRKGATKRTLSFSNSGVTKSANASGTHVEMSLSGAVNNSALSVTGTDSRGKAVTAQTSTVQLVDFNRCTITKAEAYRTSGTGTTAMLRVEGTWHDMSFGSQRNTIGAQYRWRHIGGSWSGWNNFPKWTTSGGKFVGIYDTGSWTFGTAYEVQFIARDTITAVESVVYQINSGEPTLALDTVNKALGVGVIPTNEKGSVSANIVNAKTIKLNGGTIPASNTMVTKVAGTNVGFDTVGGYAGFSGGSYIRMPGTGLLPSKGGVSGYIGTSGWKFQECNIQTGNFDGLYAKGVAMNFKYENGEKWTGDYWIDGKPIYVKCWRGTGNNTANTSFYTSANVGNIDVVIDYHATCYCESSSRVIRLPFFDFDPNWGTTILFENPMTGTNGFRIYTRNRKISSYFIFMYYTKK